MKLDLYSPTFRNVLFEEVREEKTARGIFIPQADLVLTDHSDMFEKEKVVFDGKESFLGTLRVVKTGADCIVIRPGDFITLTQGIRPERITLDDKQYFQVMEQQIIGYARYAGIRNAPASEPEIAGGSKL